MKEYFEGYVSTEPEDVNEPTNKDIKSSRLKNSYTLSGSYSNNSKRKDNIILTTIAIVSIIIGYLSSYILTWGVLVDYFNTINPMFNIVLLLIYIGMGFIMSLTALVILGYIWAFICWIGHIIRKKKNIGM
jgi:F0F1-type ATP synthase assembly protein I